MNWVLHAEKQQLGFFLEGNRVQYRNEASYQLLCNITLSAPYYFYWDVGGYVQMEA